MVNVGTFVCIGVLLTQLGEPAAAQVKKVVNVDLTKTGCTIDGQPCASEGGLDQCSKPELLAALNRVTDALAPKVGQLEDLDIGLSKTEIDAQRREDDREALAAYKAAAALVDRCNTRWLLKPAAAAARSATEAQELRLELGDEGVMLRNNSKDVVKGIYITARDGDGRQYRVNSTEPLEPGSEWHVPFVLFDPELPAGAVLKQIDVVVRDTPAGKQTMTLAL